MKWNTNSVIIFYKIWVWLENLSGSLQIVQNYVPLSSGNFWKCLPECWVEWYVPIKIESHSGNRILFYRARHNTAHGPLTICRWLNCGVRGDSRLMTALRTPGFLSSCFNPPNYLTSQLLKIVEQSSLIMTYLNQTLWMRVITVITNYNPPLARVAHVFFKFLPLNCHLAVFVGASNKFKTARW